jgi:hypothetical protein
MSLSPRDMDFLEAKNAAAREIALALGVPPMLLGIPGDNTYANFQEANRTFWRQTVLPLVKRTAQALSGWLASPHVLTPDLDTIDALTGDRDALWTRLQATSFLTDDEKRAAVGYGPKPIGALTQKFNPHHDDRGRFDFAPDGSKPEPIARRRPPRSGTPCQDARLAAARARANDAARRAQELDPNWRPPAGASSGGIEADIAYQEAVANAAEARIAEIQAGGLGGNNGPPLGGRPQGPQGQPTLIPFGMRDPAQYFAFGSSLRDGLTSAGYGDVEAYIRGSAVTGYSFETGLPFDDGRVSDYDLALVSPTLMQRATDLGIELRSGGTRTGPLTEDQLRQLGLFELTGQLSREAGRDVGFMIYESPAAVIRRGPAIMIPGRR